MFSGPVSCLCSKPEECEITGDNELDVMNGLTEVTIFVEYFIKNILIYLLCKEYQCQEACASNDDCGYYNWYEI